MTGTVLHPLDVNIVHRAANRLLRQKAGGSWRDLESVLGVDHGYIVRLVKHGIVPRDPNLRATLGLPAVMPSERKPRRPRSRPEGSPCRGCAALKEFRAGKKCQD